LVVGVGLMYRPVDAATPVFHLNFAQFADLSGNNLPIDVGDAVSLVPGGGPKLANGVTLDSARWEGVEDETNQIIIRDNPILDDVAAKAGSIVAWIKPEDGDEWNNIAKTPCEGGVEPCEAFSQFVGIEFQASGPHAGVFGAAQGWDTNVFGPNSPLGPGGETDTPSGVWTHAAIVWADNGDHTIYVNGEPGDTVFGVTAEGGDPTEFGQNMPDFWTIGGDSLGVAADNTDLTRYLRGELADFGIFKGALTQAEIQEIMRSGIRTSLSGDFDRNGALDLADVNALNGAIAGMAHPASFDLNADAKVDKSDLTIWVKDLKKTWFGDADLDGEFNSGDFVAVFTLGKYEQDQDALWNEGDWSGDRRFNSGDFVAAFTDGGYEKGPRAAAAVPEPSAIGLLAVGLIACGFIPSRPKGKQRLTEAASRCRI
jgi:hypothetical protein